MADKYVSTAYVQDMLGTGYTTAVAAALDLDQQVEAATAVVQVAMRNSGYTPPTSTDGTGVEEFVKLATLGALQELVASAPETAIALPETWETNPAKMAFAQIVSGDAKLAATPSQTGSVGGIILSDSDIDNESSVYRKTTRERMTGY